MCNSAKLCELFVLGDVSDLEKLLALCDVSIVERKKGEKKEEEEERNGRTKAKTE